MLFYQNNTISDNCFSEACGIPYNGHGKKLQHFRALW